MKHTHRSMTHWLVAAAILAVGLPALHADGLDDFKLTRAIPADVFMVSHSRSHDGQAFLNAQVARVWKALEDAHIERDIRKLLRGLAEAEEQAESFEENWRKYNDLLAGVEWSAIAKQEFAFAMKLDFPAPQWVMLMIPEQGKAKSSFENLSGMMQALVDFAPQGELTLTKDDQGDTSVHKLAFAQVPFPLGFVLARHKDTLMFSFGTSMPEQTLAMLSGQGGSPLSASERFNSAFSGLPTPTDGLFYIDIARLMKQLRKFSSGALDMVSGGMDPSGESMPLDPQALLSGTSYGVSKRTPIFPEMVADASNKETKHIDKGGTFFVVRTQRDSNNAVWYDVTADTGFGWISGASLAGQELKDVGAGQGFGPAQIAETIGNALDAVDMFDYSASVATTKDKKKVSHAVTVLHDGAKSSPLYPVLFANKPISDPLRFIPKEASEASVSVGINPTALYKAVTGFVKENIPGGQADMDDMTEMIQATAGLNLETDILSWIEGGMTYFSVPGKTPYSPGDWVMMISVNDEAKAGEMLNRLITEIEPLLVSQNGAVGDAVIDGAEGFKSITHPMMQMLPIGRPTIGVAAGQLMLGSSPRAIERSLAVADGKAPNFAKNERFQKEGVMPTGQVLSMSFTDTSKFGEELGSALQMAPMLTMMPPLADVFADPSARAVLSIISKLGPVLQKIDFLLSTSAVTTMEGNRILTKSVTNYREPPTPKVPSGDSPGE